MTDYTSRKTVQLQKQYVMLMKSLIFSSSSERNNIYDELDRLESEILNETDVLYNQEYDKLDNVKTSLLVEEKDKLVSLIELIEKRRRFVEDEVEKHRRDVNPKFEMPEIRGLDKINEFQKKIRIIDKYIQNVKLRNKLIKEIDDLKDKLNKSETKIRANERVNKELETKLVDMLERSFKAMDIYSYVERKEEIELAYEELSFAKEKAIQNIESAKMMNDTSLLVECEKMYDSIEEEYRKYFEKKMVLMLLNVYDMVVNNYDDLLRKREEINDILMQIDSSDFYKLVFSEINKQYNTIKLEQQDLKTFKSLDEEKKSKERLLNEIEKENSSNEFVVVLDDLLKNEKAKQEKEEQLKRKEEYEERQRKLIEDNKKHDEIRKKQKKIEEARKREIEIRTKEMLERQRTGVIPKVSVKERVKEDKKSFENNNLNKIDKVDKIDRIDRVEKKIGEKAKEGIIPNFFPVKEDDALENVKVDNSKYDDILSIDNKKEKVEEFKIPVIKNDKLVAKKVNEEKNNDNNVDVFMKKFLADSKKEEAKDVGDIVFPDMPI